MTEHGAQDRLADEPRLQVWRQWTDWPLTVLAASFFALYAVQVLYVSASPRTTAWLEGAIWALWLCANCGCFGYSL